MQVVEMPLPSPLRMSKPQGTADSYAAQLYLNTYDVDRRSIFVGNLPHDITERGVQELLSSCGSILSVVVNKRRSIREGLWRFATQELCTDHSLGCDLNVYAFVEFSDFSAVQNAITTKVRLLLNNITGYITDIQQHGHFMGGLRLKVTQKHSDYHREDRPVRRSTEYENQTPNYRSPAQVSDTTMTPLTPYYASPYGSYPVPFNHGSWSSGGYPTYPGQQYSYGYGATPYWSGSPGYATRNTGSENGNATSAPAPYYPVYSPYTPEYYPGHYQIHPPGYNTSGYTSAATVNAADGNATSPSPAGDADAFIMQESTRDNQ
jgi:RNA recognition motif-containing protein